MIKIIQKKVIQAGKEFFDNPEVQKWWDNEGKWWYNGIYRNAGDEGDNPQLQGDLLNFNLKDFPYLVNPKSEGGNLFLTKPTNTNTIYQVNRANS